MLINFVKKLRIILKKNNFYDKINYVEFVDVLHLMRKSNQYIDWTYAFFFDIQERVIKC